jgi:tetratricopeptide (TPR) repeat protein
MAVPDLQDALDCFQQEDVDGAIATLKQKVDELPAHLTAYVLLARAHEAKHQWEEALRCWENVYFLMPNSPVAREGKRRVLRRMDRDKEAAEIEEAAPSPPSQTESSSESSPPEEKPADDAAGAETADEPPSEPEPAKKETPATRAVSELEKLRRKAEDEARKGGARPELTDTPEAPTEPASSDPSSSSPTPEERVNQIEEEDDDLDRLINELESARIEPNPDVEDAPAPDLESDVDDIVSETLARIHEAQDQYRQAAQIYVKLASQEPDQARAYLEKAAEMRRKAERNTSEDDA